MRIEIKIGDKVLPCSLGLGFLGNFIEETGIGVTEIGENLNRNPFKYVPLLLFHSTKTAGSEISLEEVTELLDNNGGLGNDEVNRFLLAWTKSMTKDVPIEEADKEEAEEEKK